MNKQTNKLINKPMKDSWMNERMDGCMYVWINEWMNK